MDEKEKDAVDIENDFEICEEMEKNFAKVVAELISDRSLDRFRKEYESLHEALVQSHEHNTVLMDKCRTLNQDIIMNASKISSVLTLSQNDQRTIANLRREFERAWLLVQASQDREVKSNDVILNLSQEITNLKYLIENAKMPENSTENDNISLQDVQREVNSLKNDIKVQNEQSTNLRRKLDEMRISTVRMENDTIGLKKEYDELLEENEVAKNEFADIEKSRIDILDSCFLQSESIKSETSKSNSIKTQIRKQKSEIRRQKHLIQQCNKDKDMLNELTAQVRLGLSHLHDRLKDMKALTAGNISRIKEKEKAITNSRDAIFDFRTEIEALDFENEEIGAELSDCRERRRLLLKAKEDSMNRLNHFRQQEIILNSNLNSLLLDIRQKDIELSRTSNAHRELQQKVKSEASLAKGVENQICQTENYHTQLKRADHETRKKMVNFEENISQFKTEKFQSESSASSAFDHLHEFRLQIDSSQAILDKSWQDIQRSSQFSHIMRDERDRLLKDYLDVRKENESLSVEILSTRRLLSTLKESVRSIDEQCVLQHVVHIQATNSLHSASLRCHELSCLLRDSFLREKGMQYRVHLSSHVLEEGLRSLASLRHSLFNISAQNRDIVKEFEKKKGECDLVLEKCRVLTSLARIGRGRFIDQTDRVRRLMDDLSFVLEKGRELSLELRGRLNARKEIARLERALFEQRAQGRALEDEVERPRNVHRWRLIEATDPALFQLVSIRNKLVDDIALIIARHERTRKGADCLRREAERYQKILEKVGWDGKYFCEDEIDALAKVYKLKSLKLKEMEEKMYQRKQIVDNGNDQLKSVRCQIRRKKCQISGKKHEINELIFEIASPFSHSSSQAIGVNDQIHEAKRVQPPSSEIMAPHPPKFAPTKRAPCRFVGGGFEVGRVALRVIEHSPPKQPPVEFRKKNKKTKFERLNAVLVPSAALSGPHTSSSCVASSSSSSCVASSSARKSEKKQNWAPPQNSSRRQKSSRSKKTDYY